MVKIKVKNKQIDDRRLSELFGQLRNNRRLSTMSSMKIRRLHRKLVEVATDSAELMQKIAKERLKTDEKGEFLTDEKNPNEFIFKSDEDKELFLKEQEEWREAESELEVDEIKLNDLAPMNLSANDLDLLEPFVTDLSGN